MSVARRNLGVWDGEFQQQNAQQLIQDATHMEVNEGIQRDVEDAAYVGDKTTSVANIERQLGKPMAPAVFKRLIEAASFRVKLEKHPHYKTWVVYELRNLPAAVRGLTAGSQRVYIGAVGGQKMDTLPEWSIMEVRERRVPSQDRKDPVGKVVRVPGRMEARGWRSMLALLVAAKLVSKPAAERIIRIHGSEARPSWQATVGDSARNDFLS